MFDNNDVNIREFDNFLTHEECDKIIQLSNGKLFESRVYSESDDLLVHDSRKSNQCWLYDNEDTVIQKISNKVEEITNTKDNHQEPLQIVHYNTGGYFKPHYDACVGDKDYCDRFLGDTGQRLLTFIIYLNDDYEGGETHFPKVNKSVKPKKGKAVLFYNIDSSGKIIDNSLHGGNPIIKGTKWICNKWIRINKNK